MQLWYIREGRVQDDILRRMEQVSWTYPLEDPAALEILERRIAETGRNLSLITYSDLVDGVVFSLPSVRGGKPFQIEEWTGLDRGIIGEFLGYISTRSYREAGFMASALVVNSTEYRPSDHFFRWMAELEVLPNRDDDAVLAFWADQVNKAHNWYSATRRRRPAAGGKPGRPGRRPPAASAL